MLLQWIDDPAVLAVLIRGEVAGEQRRHDHGDGNRGDEDEAGHDNDTGWA